MLPQLFPTEWEMGMHLIGADQIYPGRMRYELTPQVCHLRRKWKALATSLRVTASGHEKNRGTIERDLLVRYVSELAPLSSIVVASGSINCEDLISVIITGESLRVGLGLVN